MNDPQHRSSPLFRFLRFVIAAIVVLAVVAGIVISGIAPRIRAEAALQKETAYMAIANVNVMTPKRGAPAQEIILPATIQAFTDAPIYARTNGYLKKWYFDIGAHVKTGQLLADIDTPEITQQVDQARADLATADANLILANTTATRYQDLLKTDSVAKQDVDNAVGSQAARKSAFQSAQSNLRRLEEMQSFQKIYAPFDGTITARNTDIGALIDSGSSTQGHELFHISATDRVRVYVSVPEIYTRMAKPGLTADLTLAEYPGRRFKATFVSTASSIDPASRTLLVEFGANNPSGDLLPGAYTEIHLQVPSGASTFIIPVTSLIFRAEGMRIAIVKSDNHAALLPVTLGRDFGNDIEVVAGLSGDERIIQNPPDSLIADQVVRISQQTGGPQ